MGEIKFFTSLVLIVLFSIAVVGYAVNFAIDNNSAVKLTDDATMNSLSDNLEVGLSNSNTQVNSSMEGFFATDDEISGTDAVTKSGRQFKLGMTEIASTMGYIYSAVKSKIFGGNPLLAIFITSLGVVLSYVAIRYVWKTWKGGNPD